MHFVEELEEFVERVGGTLKWKNRKTRCGSICEVKLKNVLGYTSKEYEFCGEDTDLEAIHNCASSALVFLKERKKDYCDMYVRDCIEKRGLRDPILVHLHMIHDQLEKIENRLDKLESKFLI
ncbi:MAG TPA: hypothetical protein PKD85_00685 [Saprospiraceae bacterium]|nr:hypothetical protein [Saprospiraceae bacterium]